MKRIIGLLLCITVIFGAVGCAQSPTEVVPEVAPETAPEVAPETAPEVAPVEPVAEESSGKLDFTGRTITVGVWGGAFAENIRKAYVVPFETETGGKVILEEYGNDVTALVRAQVEQGIPGFDLISGTGALDQVDVMQKAGAVQKFDWSKIENADDIIERGKFEYAMGQYVVSTNFTFNTEYFPNGGPDDAKKFYDVENYPGPRALVNFSPTGVLEQALLADGVAKEDLYPLDVDRAFAMLDKVKPSITKWWGSGSEIFQALSDAEAVSGSFWISHAYRAQNNGAPVEISFKDMSLIADCWAIPTNAQDLEMVYAFLNYTVDGQRAANYARFSGYGPLVKSAYDYLTEEEQMKLNTFPANEEQGFWCDVEYWQENFTELTERYLAWIAE